MEREVIFGQTLEKIRKKAKEQGGMIAPEEVAQAFASFSLDQEQLAMIHAYLKQRGIGIGEPADPDVLLDDTDRNYLRLYLQELKRQERLSAGEREALTLSVMAGDREARQRLIGAYLPEVADMARLYAGQGVTLEDLVGEGNVALVAGMEMLGTLEHASQAQGLLGRMIMEAMEHLIAEQLHAGSIGKQAAEQVNKVADAARELSDALLRKVTVQELSAESGILAEEIWEALRLSAGKIDGIEDADGNREPGF